MSFSEATTDLVHNDPIPPAAWNQVKNDLTNAIDGADGGEYSNANAIQINGDFRHGTNKRPLLVSRDVDRFLKMSCGHGDGTQWTQSDIDAGVYRHWTHTAAGAPGFVHIDFEPPNGNVIKTIVATYLGATGGTLPVTMPNLSLVRMAADGTETTVANVDDSSASNAAYVASHTITLSAIAHTADTTANQYFVRLRGPQGGGTANNSILHSIKVTYTMTSMPEW